MVRLGDATHVIGDARRLEQVFWNLLTNAIKFTPEEGRVEVRLETTDRVRVSVSDNGSGIDPQFLPHVFERFQQADDSSRSQGLGLGLAIVRRLVELHGGSIVAQSEGVGRGASFVVELPMLQAAHLKTPGGQGIQRRAIAQLRDAQESASAEASPASPASSSVPASEPASLEIFGVPRIQSGVVDQASPSPEPASGSVKPPSSTAASLGPASKGGGRSSGGTVGVSSPGGLTFDALILVRLKSATTSQAPDANARDSRSERRMGREDSTRRA